MNNVKIVGMKLLFAINKEEYELLVKNKEFDLKNVISSTPNNFKFIAYLYKNPYKIILIDKKSVSSTFLDGHLIYNLDFKISIDDVIRFFDFVTNNNDEYIDNVSIKDSINSKKINMNNNSKNNANIDITICDIHEDGA